MGIGEIVQAMEKDRSISTSGVPELLAELAAAHKHLCPRQVLGVRMGTYAGELLRLDLPQRDKRLYTFVETDGCFVDGIRITTGCSIGHRTLRLMDYGKVAATCIDTQTGSAIRIWPSPQCRTHALSYAPNSPNRWRAQLEAYQIMPAEKLLSVCEVELLIDIEKLISKPGVRVNCSICGEEILNCREAIRDDRVLCISCSDGGYVRCLNAKS